MESFSLKLLNSMEAGFALFEIVTDENGNLDMKFLFANKYYATQIGCIPETIIGKSFSKLVPNDVAWIPMFAEVAFREREVYPFESYSAEVNIYAHTQLFSPRYGQVAIIVHDRSQFVKNEIVKEREEQGTRLMMAIMPEGLCYGVVIYNEAGDIVDLNCIIVNEAFEILTGVRVGSLQGRYFFELYPNEFKKDLIQINKAMKSNEIVTFIRDGFAERIIEVSLYPQDNNQLIVVMRNVTERVKAEKELQQAHKTILSSVNYASKIQYNILPKEEVFKQAFSDYSIIWKPCDIVGGDIFWIKNFDQGTVLCVCDCTGHGISGALLTMLVVTTFDDYVTERNCSDTAGILWNLEQKLVSVFNRKLEKESYENKDGCDLAALFIAKDGSVTISSAHTHVYICDGEKVTQLKGQRIFIGEASINSKDDIKVIRIPKNPNNKFYIASDGLSDQPGGPNNRPYGYSEFKRIMLDNHCEEQSVISDKIWHAFENWRGKEARVDDFELISFKL